MNCIDVQRLIMPFINDELDMEQLEYFVHHVNSCPDCMEELEVYYVLLAGMKQLDEDKELSNDFHQDLMNILRQTDERIIHFKFLHIRKRIILIILISLVAIISSVRIGEFVVEDVLNKEVTESNYLVDNIFRPKQTLYSTNPELINKNQSLDRLISKNLTDIYVYLRVENKDSAKLMEKKFGDKIWENEKIDKGVGLQLTIPDTTILYY
jgi:hypothetical protein